MDKTELYRVIVAERARNMLAEHISFLANVSPAAARETKSRLMAAIRSLEKMPRRFPFLQAAHIPPNKYHKMTVESLYLLLYQVKDDTVYVDYIVDCRQDYGWLIK